MNHFDSDTLACIRRFLCNRELIETVCVCRAWRAVPGQSLFTELCVTQHDDLMWMIRRYLQHRQTICRTVLRGMDLSEWPFQSKEMVLVACRGTNALRSNVKTFRYQHQYERYLQTERYDQYVESLRNMERLTLAAESSREDR